MSPWALVLRSARPKLEDKMPGAATDERRRRWRAHIDLQAGRTRVHPVDDDPRPTPATSALLDAVRRPPRAHPGHLDPDPTAAPLQPWARTMEPAAQPQDAERRGQPDVRIPAAPSATTSVDLEPVIVRLREMLGLRPEEPPIAPLHLGETLASLRLNPAGAFVEEPPVDETFAPASDVNPAGSFAS